MVVSMIIPMEMASPPRDIRFALIPASFMTMNVASSDSGNAMRTTILPRILFSSRYSTIRTRMEPSISALFTVLTLAFTISLLS